MLSYTTLEDAYNLSLTGQRQHRKKRKEELPVNPPPMPPQAMHDVAGPLVVSNTAHVPVAPQIPPTQQPTINAIGSNPMFVYIAVLVVLVFAGMIYDMRTSLQEIQQTLKLIASSKSLL